MMEPRLVPEKARVLSGSVLKLLAAICMLIDHTGAVIVSRYPQRVLLSVMGKEMTLYQLMRFVGRPAFPLFAFLLAEGFMHTRDRLRYTLRLGAFALLSEVPFDLALHGKPMELSYQNVCITLCLSFLGLWALERFQGKSWKQLLAMLGLYGVVLLARCDYGVKGYGFVLLLYLLRTRPVTRAVLGSAFLSAQWKAGLAFVPIAFYNGERGFVRGRWLRYAFYLFYPAHLLLLYGLKVLLGL